MIEGLKGYERLLSLSKDKGNPRWKPLHLSAGWNNRNRRIAKQMSRTNWYKDKPEVEPPTDPRREEKMARFSIHKEDHSTLQEEPSSQQEDHSIREEDPGTSEAGRNHPNPEEGLPGGSRQDTTLAGPGADGWRREGRKKRGPGRGTVTLVGLNKIR